MHGYLQMKNSILILIIAFILIQCDLNKNDDSKNNNIDFSGIYCLNLNNIEMTIIQTGEDVTFTVQKDFLMDGTGTINGDTLVLNATTSGGELFSCRLTLLEDDLGFSGSFQIEDNTGNITVNGILLGYKGACEIYDIDINEIPKFVEADFTQLSKIDKISKFRSGFGHSYTDMTEDCRSMKHYFNPYQNYRENNTVEIYSPVNGTIVSLLNDYEGSNNDLKNIEIQIRSDEQPAFIFDIFHCDLISSDISMGKEVQAGELLGYATLYYDTWQEYVTSFDIAVWVNTPYGTRLVSYFETLNDNVFNNYISRGIPLRENFIIQKELRDSNPLECAGYQGQEFVTEGELDNWVILNSP